MRYVVEYTICGKGSVEIFAPTIEEAREDFNQIIQGKEPNVCANDYLDREDIYDCAEYEIRDVKVREDE